MGLDRDVLTDLAHELRGPLNGVLGLSALLLNGTYGPVSDRQRTAVEMIERSGRQLLGRIDSVVAYLAVATAPPHAVKAETELRGLVVSAIGSSPSNLVVSVPVEARAVVDAAIVSEILIELVANALRNTSPEGTIEVAVDPDGTTLQVRDTGRGLPHGREAGVFAPFARVHDDENSDEHPGLGLARCRLLAEAHGSSLDVVTTPGRGCTFVLTL